MLRHMPFAIPAQRVFETESMLAFFHPKPAHPFHVLFIPRQSIRSLADIEPADPFLSDVILATQSLVKEYHLHAYRLVVNGGAYQDFPHLHFHLVSDSARPGQE